MSQRGEGWAVGDLALAVGSDDDWIFTCVDGAKIPSAGPRPGSLNTVRKVSFSSGYTVLWFEDWPGNDPCDGYNAAEFRKINPHTPDSFDHEVIEQMAGLPVDA